MTRRPAHLRSDLCGLRVAATLLLAVLVVAVLVPAVQSLVEITVTDATIAELTDAPSAADPGPILLDLTDGLSFSTAGTNEATAWSVALTAMNNTSASYATIQGTNESFASWFFLKADTGTRFTDVVVTGRYDADAANYTAPLLFTKSSQGTLSVKHYETVDPTDGGDGTTTYYWIYDAGANVYVFGTSKDLSLATEVTPLTTASGPTYAQALSTNPYVVSAVGTSPEYLPTLRQGQHFALLGLPGSATYHVLMDTPNGVHEDTYAYVVAITAHTV